MNTHITELYEDIIKVNKGVLYIMGTPGEGKTAILEYIAKRNEWVPITIPIGLYDSSEMQGIPRTKLVKILINGIEQEIEVSYFAPPEWLIKAIDNANKGVKTLLIMDELNRGKVDVQNTVLRMFNERMIGQWKIPDSVYFAATGNLGEDDGCTVEDFDTAMIGRLIPVEHNLTIDEWVDNWAGKNVNNHFVDFMLATKISNNYKKTVGASDGQTTSIKPYLCYRSLTTLSYHVGGVEETDLHKVMDKVSMKASYIIGSSAKKSLLDYLQSLKMINLDVIMNNYDSIEDELKKIKRDKQNEIIEALKKQDIALFTAKQTDNIIKFLELIHKDELVPLLQYIMTDAIDGSSIDLNDKEKSGRIKYSDNIKKICKKFIEEFDIAMKRGLESISGS